HHFLDAVLGGAVPHHDECLLLLGNRRDTKADAGRDQAVNGIDLFLQDQASKPFDRVFRVGLFLDHQLELATGDATVLVHPLGGPLNGADTALAGGASGAGSRRDDADLERLVLGQPRRKQPRRRGGDQPGTRQFGKIATRELHGCLPLMLRICRAFLAYHKYIRDISSSDILDPYPVNRATKCLSTDDRLVIYHATDHASLDLRQMETVQWNYPPVQ